MSKVYQGLAAVILYLFLIDWINGMIHSVSLTTFINLDCGCCIYYKLEREGSHLLQFICITTQVKLDEEVEVMQYANEVGSKAHVQMMQSCKPGMMEYQLESSFLYYCYMNGGARKAAYTPIAASGPNGAILHYGHEGCPNSKCRGRIIRIGLKNF